MSDWILKHFRPFRRYRPEEPVYLRYGVWARGSRSMNHQTRVIEKGLSVYRACVKDGVVELADTPSTQLEGQGRVVFAVQGKLAAYGSDGEPVLQDVRVIRLPISISSKII